MKFQDFESIVSAPRLSRYLDGCGGNTKNAMTLYRLNLKLSQEMFTVISCMEIALRNKISLHYEALYGTDWMRDFSSQGGRFDANRTRRSQALINRSLRSLGGAYTPDKLTAKMDFGFWRYLFANPQFSAAGSTLLRIFPARPRSSPQNNYNQAYIYQELEKVNIVRNRIAHHKPICFRSRTNVVDSAYVRRHHQVIMTLFSWMAINSYALLYGLDHVLSLANKLDEY